MIKLCYFCNVLKSIKCFRTCPYFYKKKPINKIYYRNKCKKCDTTHRRGYMRNYYNVKKKTKNIKIRKYKPVDKNKDFDKKLIFYVRV